MKFRGLMSEHAALRDFSLITSSIATLSKECVIRLTSSIMYFIVPGNEAGPKQPFVWCELPIAYYFKEYTLEGANIEVNEIFLSLDSGLLTKATTTLKQNGKSIKMKLTNKQTPCLTLDVEQLTGSNLLSRQCVHDIPVEVIASKYWNDYSYPNCNDFHVTLDMPPLMSIKNIVERMRNVNSKLILTANKHGRLIMRVKTNMVTISAHFPDLNVQSFAVASTMLDTCNNTTNTTSLNNEQEDVSVMIDAKKFLTVLTAMQFNNTRTICSIVNSHLVKLHVEQPGALTMQCFFTEIDG